MGSGERVTQIRAGKRSVYVGLQCIDTMVGSLSGTCVQEANSSMFRPRNVRTSRIRTSDLVPGLSEL